MPLHLQKWPPQLIAHISGYTYCALWRKTGYTPAIGAALTDPIATLTPLSERQGTTSICPCGALLDNINPVSNSVSKSRATSPSTTKVSPHIGSNARSSKFTFFFQPPP